MANRLAQFGNDLHSGRRSFPFVEQRRRWLSLALVLILLSGLLPLLKGGFNLGIEFRGGSEFLVSQLSQTDLAPAQQALDQAAPEAEDVRITAISSSTIRLQMGQLSDEQTLALGQALQESYKVEADQVTSSYVGPTWGAGVTRQALIGLSWFILLVMLGMALYFRTWKMALSAIAGLIFTIVTTVGFYALVGFEITPSAIIGFLTVLSYSLYDTVVVFDKIRENTAQLKKPGKKALAQQVNLAVNQTLVRSINTSIVGILPVGSILFIGALLLGAGTLKDLSLALFLGIIIGTLGTLFVAAPAYAALSLAGLKGQEDEDPEEAGQLAAEEGQGSESPVLVSIRQVNLDSLKQD